MNEKRTDEFRIIFIANGKYPTILYHFAFQRKLSLFERKLFSFPALNFKGVEHSFTHSSAINLDLIRLTLRKYRR